MKGLIHQIPSTEPTTGQLAQMERKYGMFIHFGVNTFGNVEGCKHGTFSFNQGGGDEDAESKGN